MLFHSPGHEISFSFVKFANFLNVLLEAFITPMPKEFLKHDLRDWRGLLNRSLKMIQKLLQNWSWTSDVTHPDTRSNNFWKWVEANDSSFNIHWIKAWNWLLFKSHEIIWIIFQNEHVIFRTKFINFLAPLQAKNSTSRVGTSWIDVQEFGKLKIKIKSWKLSIFCYLFAFG